MINKISLFIKANAFKAIIPVIAAFLLPIKPLLFGSILFSISDLATGIIASRRRKEAFSWSKFWKKTFHIGAYIIAIVFSYYFEKLFLEWLNIPLCKVVSFVIISAEFWSNLENIASITGLPLNKQAILTLAAKFKPKSDPAAATPTTENTDAA